VSHAEQPTLNAPDQDCRQAANRPDLRITHRLALGGPQPKFDTQDEVTRRRQVGANMPRHCATPTDMRRQRPIAALTKMIDNKFESICRDGGIRTRGLLLPNQLNPVA
jgi:hypothetical protein